MNSERKAVANYQTTGKYLENKKKKEVGKHGLNKSYHINLTLLCHGGRRVDDIIYIDSSKALDIVSY